MRGTTIHREIGHYAAKKKHPFGNKYDLSLVRFVPHYLAMCFWGSGGARNQGTRAHEPRLRRSAQQLRSSVEGTPG